MCSFILFFCIFSLNFETPCNCCNQHATTPSTMQTSAQRMRALATRVNKLEMQTPICQQKRRTLSLSFFHFPSLFSPVHPLSIFRPSWLLHCWWKGSAFVSRHSFPNCRRSCLIFPRFWKKRGCRRWSGWQTRAEGSPFCLRALFLVLCFERWSNLGNFCFDIGPSSLLV